MTTRITIEAHCADDTEVKIIISDTEADTEHVTLQDGETKEYYVYDARQINVFEVEKVTN